ncbi:MAG: glycosyltransferase [Bacteroidia bacterium]|nr:glycosyltransferase [Bacteroidia bacterium]
MLPVTVIIPARNEAENVARLIESLKNQNKPPQEIIVVDAGSTDNTAEVARGAGARVIRVDKAYPGQARNIGIVHAHYDILAFWDASMWVAPHTLSALVEPLLSGEADLVQGTLDIRPKTVASQLFFLVLHPPYSRSLPEGVFLQTPPVACTALRKVLWEKVGGFKPWRAREDSDFRQRVESIGIRTLLCTHALTIWEPAERTFPLLRKIKTYGRHNLLSGKPQAWYGGLLRTYGVYLLLSLPVAFWKGNTAVIVFFIATMLMGGFFRTLYKIFQYGSYFREKLGGRPYHPFTVIQAWALLLAADVASFMGAVEWLFFDLFKLHPERFPEPILLSDSQE